MRCVICDYCEGEVKSVFYSGVTEPKGVRNRHVYLDRITGEPICTVCQEFVTERKSKVSDRH